MITLETKYIIDTNECDLVKRSEHVSFYKSFDNAIVFIVDNESSIVLASVGASDSSLSTVEFYDEY